MKYLSISFVLFIIIGEIWIKLAFNTGPLTSKFYKKY